MGKLKFHATADFLSDATGTMHEKWATLQCMLYTSQKDISVDMIIFM